MKVLYVMCEGIGNMCMALPALENISIRCWISFIEHWGIA